LLNKGKTVYDKEIISTMILRGKLYLQSNRLRITPQNTGLNNGVNKKKASGTTGKKKT
jgi:hypothetical protein